MPRIPRLLVTGEEAYYHVISRTALEGMVLQDTDKEVLLNLLKWLAKVYFVEIYGFCIMGNHFHLVVKMLPQSHFSDDEVIARMKHYFKNLVIKKDTNTERIEDYREKFSTLSDFIKELKQRFSRYYNKKHQRRGYFWGERFKSVLLEEGPALLNCLAYIELNPVRAGLTKRPEEYRWTSLAYRLYHGNHDGFLKKDLSVLGFASEKESIEQLAAFREYVYEKGGLNVPDSACIPQEVIEDERRRKFRLGRRRLYLGKIRYFSDSGVLGSKAFVIHHYNKFKGFFRSKKKRPMSVPGIDGVYSLKRFIDKNEWATARQ